MCFGHSKSTSGHDLDYYCILYYSDSLVTLSNVNLGRTALEWLSKAVLLENLKQPEELLDGFLFWRFLWRPQAKRNLHLIFLQISKQILYESLQIFFCDLYEVLERLLEGSFKLWKCVSHRVNSVNIAGKMVLLVPFTLMKWVFHQRQMMKKVCTEPTHKQPTPDYLWNWGKEHQGMEFWIQLIWGHVHFNRLPFPSSLSQP